MGELRRWRGGVRDGKYGMKTMLLQHAVNLTGRLLKAREWADCQMSDLDDELAQAGDPASQDKRKRRDALRGTVTTWVRAKVAVSDGERFEPDEDGWIKGLGTLVVNVSELHAALVSAGVRHEDLSQLAEIRILSHVVWIQDKLGSQGDKPWTFENLLGAFINGTPKQGTRTEFEAAWNRAVPPPKNSRRKAP